MAWSKRILISAALVIPTISVHADVTLTQEDKQLIQQGRTLTEAAGQQGLPSDIQQGIQQAAGAKAIARQIAEQSRQQAAQGMPKQAVGQVERTVATQAPQVLIFASRSLGQKGLDDLLSAAAATQNAAVVFRGIPKGTTLSHGIWAIQALAAQHKPMPNILIDPTLFKRFSVEAVPTIMLLNADEAFSIQEEKTDTSVSLLARVAGLADPAWLIQQVAQGVRGDQGVRGPVTEILEADLIEMMKARLARIDWDAKKQQAKARFWQQQRFIELPRATRNQKRFIDPTVTVTEDIQASDGTVLVRQGTQINPLDVRPFTQAVVVFDPLDKKQMAWLTKTIPQLKQRSGVQQLTFIATRFDRQQGWDSYTRTLDAVDAPVYLLTPDVAERFALTATPSVITAQGKRFVVEEGTL